MDQDKATNNVVLDRLLVCLPLEFNFAGEITRDRVKPDFRIGSHGIRQCQDNVTSRSSVSSVPHTSQGEPKSEELSR